MVTLEFVLLLLLLRSTRYGNLPATAHLQRTPPPQLAGCSLALNTFNLSGCRRAQKNTKLNSRSGSPPRPYHTVAVPCSAIAPPEKKSWGVGGPGRVLGLGQLPSERRFPLSGVKVPEFEV